MSFLLAKMSIVHGEVERYELAGTDLNAALGGAIRIRHTGRIVCLACGSDTRKSFGDGYCYRCFTTLARADGCIIRPHTCHFDRGTCREPDWGRAHCFVPHVVYLARTSDVKVGVTGEHKVHERWGDQGAVEAVVLARTPDRKTAGAIEVVLADWMPDRTDWRKLVTGVVGKHDLLRRREEACGRVPGELRPHLVAEPTVERLVYPVRRFPAKARSARLDRAGEVSGILEGIKGQYLLLGEVAFNVRRHAGYEVDLILGP